MDAITNEIFYLMIGVLYIPATLVVLLVIEVFTGRVGRFTGESMSKLMLLAVFWFVMWPALFMPCYKARRGATATRDPWKPDTLGQTSPFAKG